MSYRLEPTDKTPEVIIDSTSGKILINGVSIPENTYDFYQDMMDAIDSYVQSPHETTEMEFRMDYFNTSTALVIRNLLRKLESLNSKSDLSIKWFYDYDDEDMMEAGSEFQYLFRELNFELMAEDLN